MVDTFKQDHWVCNQQAPPVSVTEHVEWIFSQDGEQFIITSYDAAKGEVAYVVVGAETPRDNVFTELQVTDVDTHFIPIGDEDAEYQ